jgi:hypothetical protein
VAFPFIIKFHYLPAFDTVTTQCEAGGKDASDTLKDLFSGDDGLTCPNPAGLILATGDEYVVVLSVPSLVQTDFFVFYIEILPISTRRSRAEHTDGHSG